MGSIETNKAIVRRFLGAVEAGVAESLDRNPIWPYVPAMNPIVRRAAQTSPDPGAVCAWRAT